MASDTDFNRHATLVDHMASTLGVDLEEKIMRGRLTYGQLDDAVLACTGCTQPCACEQWLGAQAETAPDAPDYCRNAALFENLRDT